MFSSAWFDTSGNEKEGPVLVAVGVLSTARRWRAFDRRFMEVLRRYHVSTLHMYDYKHSRNEFAHVSSSLESEEYT
jgi:hypothetical protein